MNIVVTSERVSPARGGLSSILDRLGRGLTETGHTVTLVMSRKPEAVDFPYGDVVSLVQEPQRALSVLRRADVVIQNNIALKTLLPALALGKKPIVVLHIWVQATDGSVRLRDRAKRALLKRCIVGAPNPALYERLGIAGHLIPNAYDSTVFAPRAEGPLPDERRRGAVFVGRLIPQKGIEELLQAHAALSREERQALPLSIVGTGADAEVEAKMREQADESTRFLGALSPEEIAELLHESTLLVAPSTGEEIFGLVILEALACGVRPVITDIEGMIQASGGFGTVVKRGESLVEELTEALRAHLRAGSQPLSPDAPGLQEHLAQYSAESMIRAYGQLIDKAAGTAASGA